MQSDKEFDKLFHDRFESFECEPPEAVWAAISDKLSKKKKTSFRFWMTAASIVLVMAAGLWLMKPKETIRLYGGDRIADNRPEAKPRPVKPEREGAPKEPALQKISTPAPYAPEKSINRPAEAEIEEPKKVLYLDKADSEDEIKLAAVETPVFDETALLQIETSSVTPDTSALVFAAVKEAHHYEAEKLSASIRDIKTVGGLVNFIVEKVDKRNQKLIEFTDTDEGSFVSGINLGFVKFKK